MAKYSIISPGYLSRSSDVNAARCVNLYPELNTEDSKSVGSLVGTPGLLLFIDTLLGPIRGFHFFNNLIYFISGNKLYSVDVAANIFPIIDSGSSAQVSFATFTGSVSMADNGMAPTGGSQLAIADGQNLLIYDVTSGVTTGISYPSKTVVFASGYFVADTGGQGYDVSALYDGSVSGPGSGGWKDLNVSTADAYPSNLIAVVNNHMELWFIKEYSTEVWDITGSASPLFARQCAIDYGTNAPYSVAKGNNTIFFLVSTRNGDNGTVAGIGMADGYGVKIVSSQMINNQLTKYAITSDAFGYCYTDAGHEFYVLTFPTANATWVYDATTKMLHERSYYQGSPYVIGRHLSNCYVYAWGKHFVGSYLDGKIYEMSEKYLDDDGSPIASLRVGPPTEDKRNNDYVFFSKMQLDAEMGVGIKDNIQENTLVISDARFSSLEHIAIVGSFSWITSDPGVVFKVDLNSGQILKAIDISAYASNPHGMAVGFGSLWVAGGGGSNAVIRIDLTTETIKAVVLVTGPNYGVACGVKSVWTSDQDNNQVCQVDPVLNQLINTYSVDTDPEEIFFGFGSVWSVNYTGNTLTRINETTGIVATIAVGNSPEGLTFSSKFVWVANSLDGTVSKIDPLTNAVMDTITVGSNAIGMAYYNGPLGEIVVCGCAAKVFFIDANGDNVLNQIALAGTSAPSAFMSVYQDYVVDVSYNNVVTKIPINDKPTNPTVLLSWSDDGGHTWSNDHPASLGVMGNYKNRAIWRRLGASRNRIFRIAISDPVKKVLIGAYMDLEGAE